MEQTPVIVQTNPINREPETPWGIGEALAVWFAFVIIQIAFGAVAMFGYGLSSRQSEKIFDLTLPGWVLISSSMAGEIAALLLLVGMVKISYGLPFRDGIKWRGTTDKTLTASLVGILLALGNTLSTILLPPPDVEKIPIYNMVASPRDLALFSVLAITVSPLVEELIFRGWIFPAFRKRMRLSYAVIINAALFAAPHSAQLGEYWIGVFLVALLGVATALLREKTDGVKAPFLCHLTYNSAIVAMEILNRAAQ